MGHKMGIQKGTNRKHITPLNKATLTCELLMISPDVVDVIELKSNARV
jgi:hypothetical protein